MRIEAYAKVNFTLEVFGKRADGYHALRSLVVPVTLSDTLTLVDAEGISSDTGYDDDLCIKAANVLKTYAPERQSPKGVSISVEKRIPAGGGCSDRPQNDGSLQPWIPDLRKKDIS